MPGRESNTGLMASSDVERASSSVAPPTAPSRAVEHSQTCILLILAVGCILIFSYQSEIHGVVLGHGPASPYSSLEATTSRSSESLLSHPIKSMLRHLEPKSRSGDEKKKAALTLDKTDVHSSATQRRLEAAATNSSTNVTAAAAAALKKKSWKDIKIEAYMPLVESVHSNVVSSNFQFVIKVLSLNNYASLTRCLSSLSKAEYAGDSVDIHIYIDHFEISEGNKRRILLADKDIQNAKVEASEEAIVQATEESTSSTFNGMARGRRLKEPANSDSSSDVSKPPRLPDRVATGVDPVKVSDWTQVEERLQEARNILNHVETFQWKHGKKVIHYRTSTAGSQSQWLDAWWPSSDDEFAFFLEDDAEVSPLYYRYVRALIATYYYQPNHHDSSLYGISLQRPQIVPGKNGQPIDVDDRTRLFKYQMIGVWGQIFFPKPWREFREWYDAKKSHNVKPLVDGMVTTDWYREHGEKMFTPWFVKFAYSKGYFNLYTNFLRDRVLSVTHRDKGAKLKKYAGCDSVLIWNNGTYDIELWHMAANWHIKRYDYCFKEVQVGRFANYSSDAAWILESVQQSKQILMVSTVGVPEILVRNWLCNIRKLGIQNYLVVGEDPVFLEDLARRGHATMRIENTLHLQESIEKDISAVSDLLGRGYTMWFTRADTIWTGNPINLVDTTGVDVIGVENSELNLFFIRSTEKTKTLWGSLVKELSHGAAVNASGMASWGTARDKFLSSCQADDEVQVKRLDQVVFTDEEQLFQPPDLQADPENGQVFVFSGLRSWEDQKIKDRLRELGLFNLDDDLVCATLTC